MNQEQSNCTGYRNIALLQTQIGTAFSLREQQNSHENYSRLSLFFRQMLECKVTNILSDDPNEHDSFVSIEQKLQDIAHFLCPQSSFDDKKKDFYALHESSFVAFKLLDFSEIAPMKQHHYKMFKAARDYQCGLDRRAAKVSISNSEMQSFADEVKTLVDKGTKYQDDRYNRLSPYLNQKLDYNLQTTYQCTRKIEDFATRDHTPDARTTLCTLFGFTAFSLEHLMTEQRIPTSRKIFLLDQTTHAMKLYCSLS